MPVHTHAPSGSGDERTKQSGEGGDDGGGGEKGYGQQVRVQKAAAHELAGQLSCREPRLSSLCDSAPHAEFEAQSEHALSLLPLAQLGVQVLTAARQSEVVCTGPKLSKARRRLAYDAIPS